MTNVDHDLQRRWLEELRSGTRTQGEGRLRYTDDDGDKWCCQGVACDLANPDVWNDYRDLWYWGDDHTYWPDNIRISLGLTHAATGILADANDVGNETFPKIADRAEQMMRDNGTHWDQAKS